MAKCSQEEYVPSPNYLEAYQQALRNETDRTAAAVRTCAERIYQDKGNKVVLVSLARAGVPIASCSSGTCADDMA